MSVNVRSRVPSLAAEFPNDNPALHCGVIWVCLAPTGRAIAELVERPPPTTVLAPVVESQAETAAAPTIIDVVVPDDEILIEDVTPIDAMAVAFDSVPPPATISSAPPAAPDDAFTVLVCTLADVAISAGAPQIASLLPGLLFDGRLPDALDDTAATLLRAAGILVNDEVHPAFIATTAAWRAILRGESDDFSACPAMLDEWTAMLLAQLLDTPTPRMRQELRGRGVAAFGLA